MIIKDRYNPMKENNLIVKQILIGEDDIDDQEILEEIFLSIDSKLNLTFINDGQKIVSFLENTTVENIPGLIILDYNMPHLNGAEILKSLQQNEQVKNVPKIIWSTANADGFKNTCLQLGACEYLVKPSSFANLRSMIKRMLSFYEANGNI
jgi:CheY-like chemotaxis protein